MKKNMFMILLISGLTFQQYHIFTECVLEKLSENSLSCYTNISNIERPSDKDKINNFWSSENEGFLSAEEKDILKALKAKAESGKNLTVEERQTLSQLRCEAIRKKLGDARFERYKKLIEKREKQEKGQLEIELTKDEKTEIYNFEKEINGK